MPAPLTNWAKNIAFSARRVLAPRSIEEIQSALRAHERVKVLGSGHSFNGIADSEGAILRLDSLPPQITLDPLSSTVRASAGITFGALGQYLHERGFAL